MNNAIASVFFFSFLALAPAILLIKFLTRRPAWWLILTMIIVLGWGLVVGTYIFNQLSINDLIAQGRDDELPEGWDSDGASGLFVMFGGWFLSLSYFAPWFAIYLLATIATRLFKPGNEPDKAREHGRG